jgi:ABC-type phosphate transport system permease subunit
MADTAEQRPHNLNHLPARFRGPGDAVFKTLVVALSSGIILLALGTAIVIYREASPTFRAFGYVSFLTETTWDPVAAIHGALPFIIGTLLTSIAALMLAVIPALGVAIFTSGDVDAAVSRPRGATTVRWEASMDDLLLSRDDLTLIARWEVDR